MAITPIGASVVFVEFLTHLDAPQPPTFQLIRDFFRDFATQQGTATPEQWEAFRNRVGRILDPWELQRLQASVPLPLTVRIVGPDRSLIVPIARADAIFGSEYREAIMGEAGMQIEPIDLCDLPLAAFTAVEALLQGRDATPYLASAEDCLFLFSFADRIDAAPLQQMVFDGYRRHLPDGRNQPRHAAVAMAQCAVEAGAALGLADTIMENAVALDPSIQQLIAKVQTATTEQQCLDAARYLSMADAAMIRAVCWSCKPFPTHQLSAAELESALQHVRDPQTLRIALWYLSVVDEPTLARIQRGFQDEDLWPALRAWCQEVSGKPEFVRRQEVSLKIHDAFQSRATKLNLHPGDKIPLTTLPDCIGYLSRLLELWVCYNQLTALPDSICRLTLLHILVIDHNLLTALPDAIGQLSRLRKLRAGENILKVLPASIGQLTCLVMLEINSNQFEELPDPIKQLSQLSSLYVSGNQLTVLPAWIDQLNDLTLLYANDNGLAGVPESIGKLVRLTNLSVSGNKLKSLPESICLLTQLKNLYVGRNQLTCLPESIGKLAQLGSLNIGINKFRTLPDSLSQLTKLTYLEVVENPLQDLPASLTERAGLYIHRWYPPMDGDGWE